MVSGSALKKHSSEPMLFYAYPAILRVQMLSLSKAAPAAAPDSQLFQAAFHVQHLEVGSLSASLLHQQSWITGSGHKHMCRALSATSEHQR